MYKLRSKSKWKILTMALTDSERFGDYVIILAQDKMKMSYKISLLRVPIECPLCLLQKIPSLIPWSVIAMIEACNIVALHSPGLQKVGKE